MQKTLLSILKNDRHTKQFILFSLSLLLFGGLNLQAETIESLVDENRVLTEPSELHLTSSDAPLINSTVSLNHEDAWLFFDNVKPSDVIATFLSSIFVDGTPFSKGVNGRIAIYGNGSVLMPHPSTLAPLTVYTEDNFSGTTKSYAIHTYHNNLGEFDNAIKSFKLKRGYVATFANNADGSGYSRVFIADNADVEFSIVPNELYGSVSFIRIFKYQWVSKKGKAGWNPNDLNGTTYYDWNIGGNSSDDIEYALIRQNGGWPSWGSINGKLDVSHLLGFNEPDRPDQSNMTFQQMLDQWPEMMKSGLRIGSPAWASEWNGAPGGGGNLFDFVDKCDELSYRMDFVALHCYWVKSPQQWYNDLKYIHERTGRPLWITEWNNGANWTTESWPDADRSYTDANGQKQLNDIKAILNVLDTAHFVERYFIYDWVQDCRAMVLGGELTKAGEYYASNTSQIAYKPKNEVIPHWNYLTPVLSTRYLTLSNTINIKWTDGNEELSRSYKLEKKVNDGEYAVIYESDDVNVRAYNDPLNPELSGKITYRISLLKVDGEYLFSNESSYFQTGGSNDVQTGIMQLGNTDWTSCYFSEIFSETPLVIMGVPSFYNIVAMTQRVTSTSTRSFKFQLQPWAYLNNPTLTKTDQLSVLTLLKGTYNLGGLNAEAGEVTNLSNDWVRVNFDKSFTNAPVVFCTQVSNKTLLPTTVAIKNVTNSSFDVSIMSEEARTGIIIPETINFLAIETGQGVINGKRITVGKTADGDGIKSSPIDVAYEASYEDPVVFGTLLTRSNTFASTVRYYDGGTHTFKLLRHRETSAGISAVSEDKLGWMIMDLSPNQATLIETPLSKAISFYPNPVIDKLYFDRDKLTQVEIYDISGQKILDRMVSDHLDLSELRKGIYLIKLGATQTSKIIKK